MRIDWDKETGEWRVQDMQGNILAKSKHVRIEAPCELCTEHPKHHGWLVVAGAVEIRNATILIRKE